MITLTKKEQREHLKELIEFCKKDSNYCLMWNYMLTIERIREEPEEKLLMKRLKAQADAYKKKNVVTNKGD